MRIRLILFVLFVGLGISSMAQVDTLVRFTPNFQFKDGVYMSIEEFQANCPSLLQKDLLDRKGRPAEGLWTENKRLYTLRNDTLVLLPKGDVWGFSEKGKVYLVKDGRQKRLQIIGSICHIVLIEEVEDFTTNNNFGRNRYNSRSNVREVNREFMIDFEEGEMIDFDLENFSEILSRDDILYQEFEKIKSKRVKQQMKFHFLTKYNEKYPIYFSISQCSSELN